MPSYYTYLISSLPALSFGAKPPFSMESFFAFCEGLIADSEIATLKRVSSLDAFQIASSESQTLKRWHEFEVALRNELVRLRSPGRKADPAKFTRQDGAADTRILHIAMSAYKNPSVLEAERLLDSERWHMLDTLQIGHYFDFDYLVAYCLKLKSMSRWQDIAKADKHALLEEVTTFNVRP